jgi:hypothetical protein
MADRMTGNGEHREYGIDLGDAELFAACQGMREACDRLGSRSVDCHRVASGACHQVADTTLMVGVVMRDQDRDQPQPFPLEHGRDRCGIARIDDDGTGAATQQPDVVVTECRNGDDVETGRHIDG